MSETPEPEEDLLPESPMGARKGCGCLGCQIMRDLDAKREPASLAVATPDTP